MAWYSIKLIGNSLSLIDQRSVPKTIEYFSCKNYRDVIYAIKDMVVRGAPAIGIAAAYGYYLGFLEFKNIEAMADCEKALIEARPTAVNLEWAVLRMKSVLLKYQNETFEVIADVLRKESEAIHSEDIEMNKKWLKSVLKLFQKQQIF